VCFFELSWVVLSLAEECLLEQVAGGRFQPIGADIEDGLQMPRVVLEHLAGRAAATVGIPGEMSTGDIRKVLCIAV
jgi:hypothetical protein